jgi:hypothetical protein
MKISYAITVCNEFIEIQRLIHFLLKHKRHQDEIIVLFDKANGDIEVENFLRSHSINGEFNWHSAEFQGHFADWKNKLTSFCKGDYIFQIDADEIPCTPIIESLPAILEGNPEVDVYLVPRVNTVEGLTDAHIQKWGWNVNSEGWVNWPDYQWRIFRNVDTIEWKNKVHEVLEGFKQFAQLPMEEDYSLYHPKTISKQEKQNNFYDNLLNFITMS